MKSKNEVHVLRITVCTKPDGEALFDVFCRAFLTNQEAATALRIGREVLPHPCLKWEIYTLRIETLKADDIEATFRQLKDELEDIL